ncbi:MAG: hypothetical protein J2P41_12135 [Blastocatellia bacterium]|nr:hypothetical protein [Blastocatellia bacterium]
MIKQTKTEKTAKLHSIHALPAGRDFTGEIEAGSAKYHFSFSPNSATIVDRKLVLAGSATLKSTKGAKHKIDKVKATLLATQGSIYSAPRTPRSLANRQSALNLTPPYTDATGDLSSVGVIYFKLSGLHGKETGLPLDLSETQLNARLYATSEVERDLHWLYSALVRATLGEKPDEENASVYLAEINRILKEA